MGAVPFFGVDIGYIHDCKGGEGACCGTGQGVVLISLSLDMGTVKTGYVSTRGRGHGTREKISQTTRRTA